MNNRSRADNVVHLTYCLTGAMEPATIRGAVGQLGVDERRRHDRFVFERDRRDFAVAHALLRRCLSAQGDRAPHEWCFAAGAHGKPSLAPLDAARNRLAFNLSHSHGLVACAVTRGFDIGVDVEKLHRGADVLELAARFFSSGESAALQQLEPAERPIRFTEMWTLKEAFIKAIGEGLSCPLDEFSFTFGDAPSLSFDSARSTESARWCFALFAPSNEHRMAIAIGSNVEDSPALSVRIDQPPNAGHAAALEPLRIVIADNRLSQRS